MKQIIFAVALGLGLLTVASPAMAGTAPSTGLSVTAPASTVSSSMVEPEWPDWFDDGMAPVVAQQ